MWNGLCGRVAGCSECGSGLSCSINGSQSVFGWVVVLGSGLMPSLYSGHSNF
jgi:hypothetical protein